MDFNEDFSQLLKIHLLLQVKVEVDSTDGAVIVTLTENLSFPLIFEIIKKSAIVCYDRLIYRRRLGDMHIPLSVIVKNKSDIAIISFPENWKCLKTS